MFKLVKHLREIHVETHHEQMELENVVWLIVKHCGLVVYLLLIEFLLYLHLLAEFLVQFVYSAIIFVLTVLCLSFINFERRKSQLELRPVKPLSSFLLLRLYCGLLKNILLLLLILLLWLILSYIKISILVNLNSYLVLFVHIQEFFFLLR